MSRIIEEMDAGDRAFGHGWISGMGALILSVIGLATVLCFWFPQWLTVSQTREFYIQHETAIRVLLFLVLVAAFGLALLSTLLRKRKALGFTAMAITLLATTMGGSAATYRLERASDIYLGLDFFLLNVIFLGVVFIPIERLFKQVNQPIFRYEWREDLFYFLISTLFVQTLTYLSLAPSMVALAATDWASGFRGFVASQPWILQFLAVMFFTDLYAYIFFVYLLSVFIHSNLRIPFGVLGYLIATPRFHHWHHGIEEEAIDKNFAIHFPVIDMLFGTFHLPADRWPSGYGVGGHPIPKGFWKQFLYPFQRDKKSSE